MRFTPKQLERKRGKKRKGAQPKHKQASTDLALFCTKDDTLMKPVLSPEDPTGRTIRRSIVYLCTTCGNVVNPISETEDTARGMTVQTRDNAIQYKGRRHTIATSKNRAHESQKQDELDKFINEPDPHKQQFGVTVVHRTVERRGTKHFKLAV